MAVTVGPFLSAVLLVALSVAACSAHLPTPRTGPHLGEQPAIVPFPPPPGKVEVIPPRPPALRDPVWIDGEWDWTGRRWQWKDGAWSDQAPDAYYAPPTTLRASDGTLEYLPGVWKKKAAPAPAP